MVDGVNRDVIEVNRGAIGMMRVKWEREREREM